MNVAMVRLIILWWYARHGTAEYDEIPCVLLKILLPHTRHNLSLESGWIESVVLGVVDKLLIFVQPVVVDTKYLNFCFKLGHRRGEDKRRKWKIRRIPTQRHLFPSPPPQEKNTNWLSFGADRSCVFQCIQYSKCMIHWTLSENMFFAVKCHLEVSAMAWRASDAMMHHKVRRFIDAMLPLCKIVKLPGNRKIRQSRIRSCYRGVPLSPSENYIYTGSNFTHTRRTQMPGETMGSSAAERKPAYTHPRLHWRLAWVGSMNTNLSTGRYISYNVLNKTLYTRCALIGGGLWFLLLLLCNSLCFSFTSEVTVTPNQTQIIRWWQNETKEATKRNNGLQPVKHIRETYTSPNPTTTTITNETIWN